MLGYEAKKKHSEMKVKLKVFPGQPNTYYNSEDISNVNLIIVRQM